MLGDLLGGRARTHVSLSYLAEPWGMRFVGDAGLTVHVLVRGAAGCAGEVVEPGDVLLVRGPHELRDARGTPPGVVVEGPGRSREPGEPTVAAGDRWRLDQARSYGSALGAETLVVHATYPAGDVLDRRVLAALPAVVRAPAPPALRELLTTESVREGAWQHAVLDRLVDLLVITVLRSRDDTGWLAAVADPVVGPVLELLHGDPARPWTVGELAGRVGVSRASLARRFPGLTGEPVIAYLRAHRLDLAAELLRTGDRTIAAIAREVGYADAFSLSAAYRRRTGRPPSTDRGPSTAR